eukprot:scaffold125045_cov36-Prasinocladus_malaysianus.AAC.1
MKEDAYICSKHTAANSCLYVAGQCKEKEHREIWSFDMQSNRVRSAAAASLLFLIGITAVQSALTA